MADFRLLESGAGFRLLEDGTSKRLLEVPPNAVTYLGASTATTSEFGTNDTTLSESHSVHADATAAIVIFEWSHFSTIAATVSGTPTLGGQNITLIGSQQKATLDGGDAAVLLYSINNPPVGSQTVSFTMSNAVYSKGVQVLSFKDVDLAALTTGFNSGSPATTAKAIAPTGTTTNGQYLVGHIIAQEAAANIACDDTQTGEWNYSSAGGSTHTGNAGVQAVTGSGAQINWTTTNTSPSIGVVVLINPAAGGGGGSSDVIYDNLQNIEYGIISQTAARLGGIIQE